MKNKKMKRGLLLASCAMLLTGCNPDALWGLGGKWNSLAAGAKGFLDDIALKLGLKKAEQKEEQKEEEKPQEGGEEQKKEVVISIEGLPEEAVVGDVVDFDEFVRVENTTASFSLELSDDSKALASIEGHKVTVEAEGEISVTVSVEDKSAVAKFGSILQVRKEFRDFCIEVGNDYYLVELNVEQDYSLSFGKEIRHGEKYSCDEEFEIVGLNSTQTGYLYAPGGYYAAPDGQVFTYYLEEVAAQSGQQSSGLRDGESGQGESTTVLQPHFEIRGDEPAATRISSPLAFDASRFEIKGAGETFFSGNDAGLYYPADKAGENEELVMSIMSDPLDFSRYTVDFAGAYVERFDIEFTDEQTGEKTTQEAYALVPIISDGTEAGTGYYDLFVIIADKEAGVDVMDECVKANYQPKSLPLDGALQALAWYADPDYDFTVSTEYGVYTLNSQTYAYELLDDDSVAAMHAQASTTSFAYLFTAGNGTVNLYYTEDQVHMEEVGLEHCSTGYIKGSDGKIYSYEYDAETQKYAATVTSFESFDDLPARENFSFMNPDKKMIDPLTGDEYTVFDNIFVNDIAAYNLGDYYGAQYDGIYQYVYSFSSMSALDFLTYLLFRATPTTGVGDRFGLGDIFYNLAYNKYAYFDEIEVNLTFIDWGTGYSQFEISGYVAFASGYYWGFTTTFTSDSIPDSVVITGLPEEQSQGSQQGGDQGSQQGGDQGSEQGSGQGA